MSKKDQYKLDQKGRKYMWLQTEVTNDKQVTKKHYN